MFSITTIIIIATCIVSVSAFNNPRLKNDLLFWPAEIEDRRQYYRFLTYGFVHADFMHLAFNMISLYSLGNFLENNFITLFGRMGSVMYILLYVLGLIFSTIPDYYYYKNYSGYRALGASGAVCAVIFAAIMIYPTMSLSFFFLPFGIPGYLFGILFLLVSVWLAKRGSDNIGHRAHFSGAIFGMLFTIVTARVFADFDVIKAFISQILNRY